MGARLTSNAFPAKVIRVVLVFALVFWASFRVECFAFGDVVHDSLSDHSEGTLNDVGVWQVESSNGVDLEGSRISSAGETADGQTSARLVPISVSTSVSFVAIPVWQDSESDSDVLVGDFLEWKIDDVNCADLNVSNGVATITGKAPGTVTVTCSLRDADEKYVSDSFKEKHKGKPFAASFQVDVHSPSLAIELLSSNGSALQADQVVTLSAEERQSYAFGAHVSLVDPDTHVEIAEFTNKDQSALDASLQALLSDFEWSLKADDGGEVLADVATIDPDGVLHMMKEGSFSVYCSIRLGEMSFPASVRVTSGSSSQSSDSSSSSSSATAPEKPEQGSDQGASRPQRQLRVVANVEAARDTGASEGASSGSSESASSGSTEKPDGASGESSSSASASSQPPASSQSASAADGGQSASSENASSSSTEQGEAKSINKVYSVEELEALGTTRAMYSMYGREGWRMVEGEGPTLAAILKDAGVEDLSKIESITFEGLYGTTEVSWSDLTMVRNYYPHALEGSYSDGEPSNPMVAIRSYQYSAEEFAKLGEAGDSGEPTKPEVGGESSSASAPSGNTGSGSGGTSGESNGVSSVSATADGSSSSAASNSSSGAASSSLSSAASSEPGSSSSASASSGSSESATTDDMPVQDEGQEQATSAPELVDNTQFRFLLGATNPANSAVEPDSLRWIHTIRVNMKAPPEDNTITDPKLRVRVGYVPVPLGTTAVFSAIPNNEIGNARFGFHWQESSDGIMWTDIPHSSVQTLRVLTTEDRVGHQFRVIMDTDLVNDEGKKRGTTSDPVTMEVGDGFAVQLAYDPPIAGDTAFFQSSVAGIADPSSVVFEWQSSTDGGETWTTIPNRTGPQLAIPTNPVEQRPPDSSNASSGSGGGEKPNPIIYIRVIARAPDGREAYSNVMPLTVRVGDSDSDNAGNDNPGTSTGAGSGDAGPGQPVPRDEGGRVPDASAPELSTPTVTEIDRIVYEDSVLPTEQTPESQGPTSTPQPSASPLPMSDQELASPEIYVNPEKSEQIIEQVEAEQERVAATIPGARWTEINVVNPGGDDVRRVLSSNPFAPFAVPFCMGLILAGGFEHFLSFRRSLK